MTKSKNFRDWTNEDYHEEGGWPEDTKFKKRDGKRYDKKKARVQSARRRKNKMKNSYFDGE